MRTLLTGDSIPSKRKGQIENRGTRNFPFHIKSNFVFTRGKMFSMFEFIWQPSIAKKRAGKSRIDSKVLALNRPCGPIDDPRNVTRQSTINMAYNGDRSTKTMIMSSAKPRIPMMPIRSK
ncbi:hypothetical protein D3C84_868730 [compost metagenome]